MSGLLARSCAVYEYCWWLFFFLPPPWHSGWALFFTLLFSSSIWEDTVRAGAGLLFFFTAPALRLVVSSLISPSFTFLFIFFLLHFPAL